MQVGCTIDAPTPDSYRSTSRPEIQGNEDPNLATSGKTKLQMLCGVRRKKDEGKAGKIGRRNESGMDGDDGQRRFTTKRQENNHNFIYQV